VLGQAAGAHRVVTASTHPLNAPHLLSPGPGAHVQQIPALTWSSVAHAASYQFEVAVDPHFHSLVLASSGMTLSSTHNLAASLDQPQIDGTYYWRVRALTATGQPGRWSGARSIVKEWSEQPQLSAPADDAAITWPADPLVLRWTPVPYASEYIVTIAADERLSNIVVGSASFPTRTEGTVFALPSTLQAGQTYYWAITPVDADGHRGARSAIRKFTWSWPTTTTTAVTPLNDPPGASELEWTPEFTWSPIPGAARYQVEVSSAEGFPTGSIWSNTTTIGTRYSPLVALNNNEYYWRVRAIDVDGNAGVWNEGPRFIKTFDHQTPTIANLGMDDINNHPTPADPTTETPIVSWSPVRGAASYEVQIGPLEHGACGPLKVVTTSSLAWTPLSSGGHIGQENWPSPEAGMTLVPGTSYCVLVAPQSDRDIFGHQIEGAPTPLGSLFGAAFTYDTRLDRCKKARRDEEEAVKLPEPEAAAKRAAAQAIYNTYEYLSAEACGEILAHPEAPVGPTPASAYVEPSAATATRTPLFTWAPVLGASEYYVVIARNPQFTNVVDVAKTQGNAYAPPVGHGANEEPLDDETTNYYWAVMPATKSFYVGDPELNHPHAFNKESVPPTPVAPVEGAEAIDQPTFRWTPVSGETSEGAVNYTLQVATDLSFSKPIDNITTDSTSYTSSSTYPANQTLYWRVRGNDTNSGHPGLNWSPVRTFKRTLRIPQPLVSNPTVGEAIPALEFTPITGAVGYDVHVELPSGASNDFTSRSTTFTASSWQGPGTFRFTERAEFPTAGGSTVAGGYSAPTAFVHTEALPTDAIGVKQGNRVVISWAPQAYARHYAVEISASETFATTIASGQTSTTTWAPNIDFSQKTNRHTLYWRVGAVDAGGNVGPYASGRLGPPPPKPKPKPKCVKRKVRKHGRRVTVCVVLHHGAKPKKHH